MAIAEGHPNYFNIKDELKVPIGTICKSRDKFPYEDIDYIYQTYKQVIDKFGYTGIFEKEQREATDVELGTLSQLNKAAFELMVQIDNSKEEVPKFDLNIKDQSIRLSGKWRPFARDFGAHAMLIRSDVTVANPEVVIVSHPDVLKKQLEAAKEREMVTQVVKALAASVDLKKEGEEDFKDAEEEAKPSQEEGKE